MFLDAQNVCERTQAAQWVPFISSFGVSVPDKGVTLAWLTVCMQRAMGFYSGVFECQIASYTTYAPSLVPFLGSLGAWALSRANNARVAYCAYEACHEFIS